MVMPLRPAMTRAPFPGLVEALVARRGGDIGGIGVSRDGGCGEALEGRGETELEAGTGFRGGGLNLGF